MKLPQFLDDMRLNDLRRRMRNAPLGSIELRGNDNRLTIAQLEELLGDGIDIKSLDEVRRLPDGTLAYKNRRIVLYIRDINEYYGRDASQSMPRFHVAECRTLQEMRETKRIGRYVVAVRSDGQFQINILGAAAPRGELKRLAICKNCLERLQFDGYQPYWASERRELIVKQFTLQRFFEIYPRDLIDATDRANETTAPLNDYSGDFGVHAGECKSRAGYRCQQCKRDLSASHLRKYLHTHHVNGLKFDNSLDNLRALCVRCHAEQPQHAHMKSLPTYIEFIRLDS